MGVGGGGMEIEELGEERGGAYYKAKKATSTPMRRGLSRATSSSILTRVAGATSSSSSSSLSSSSQALPRVTRLGTTSQPTSPTGAGAGARARASSPQVITRAGAGATSMRRGEMILGTTMTPGREVATGARAEAEEVEAETRAPPPSPPPTSSTTTTTTSSSSSGGGGSNSRGGLSTTRMAWIERVRRTGEHSDVVVSVDGEDFMLHSLPLMVASQFFRRYLSDEDSHGLHQSANPPSPSPSPSPPLCACRGKCRVQLSLIGGPAAFAVAADFCYLGSARLTIGTVASVRAAADQLEMPDLLDATRKYLYATVFGHWRSSVSFLRLFHRLGWPAVDDYIESHCVDAISDAFSLVSSETFNLSAPLPSSPFSVASTPTTAAKSWTLTEILVRIASLPGLYAAMVIDDLVARDGTEIQLECRQSRNIRPWLNHLISTECSTHSSKCWAIVCLSLMLERSCSPSDERPWLELSSQYWCGLLEHGTALLAKQTDVKTTGELYLPRLKRSVAFLEHRIGSSLHELDDYLRTFSFDPPTLVSLITHFRVLLPTLEIGEYEMQEVAEEVDSCLWKILDNGMVLTVSEFIALIDFFPSNARCSHDTIYAAVETLTTRLGLSVEESQKLWKHIDIAKLSETVYWEKALNNDSFLCQPHVLQYVLRQLNEELISISNGGGGGSSSNSSNIDSRGRSSRGSRDVTLNDIVQKVIKASLKLLEENSQRSREIAELQKHYSTINQIADLSKLCLLPSSQNLGSSKPAISSKRENAGINRDSPLIPILQDELEMASVDDRSTSARHSCSSAE